MGVKVTERALKEVKKVLSEQGLPETDYALRVGVNGGGCSGFSYSLGFCKNEEIDPLNDTISVMEGIKVVSDNKSLLFIDGTTVDFYDGLEKRGFVFDNPNATKTCGCGSSFSA